MGQEVPAAMKPMLDAMVQQGLLTDAAGNKITSLEDAGVSFAMTMSEGFNRLIAEVEKLTRAIAVGLGIALDSIPDPTLTVHVRYDVPDLPDLPSEYSAQGGLVTAFGVQRFAAGGRVLPFRPMGTDTIPAMLTPGEMVLNRDQQISISDALAGRVAPDSGAGWKTLDGRLAAMEQGMARRDRTQRQAFRTMLTDALVRAGA
jgi:hypothetical protein